MRNYEIKKIFLDYFKNKDHTYIPSSNIIPENDNTILFINAGMNQFKSIFLNEDIPDKFVNLKRACNYQKCIRAGGKHNDLDDVGKDVYHHTFFEMLGSWSFNDYGKEKAIDMAWDLLVNHYKINSKNLYVTYFEGDEKLGLKSDNDTIKFWEKYLPKNRIIKGNIKDNFCSLCDTGPCGPCTEIHYDRIGERDASHLVNQDDPNVLEIWNIVSIEYNMKDNLERLNKKFIDTGMGFERLASILQNKTSNYDTDIFTPIIEIIENETILEKYTGKIENDTDFKDMSYRVLADHLRTIIISINDGCIPGPNGRNYIIRKIIRRAIFYGNKLNLKGNFLSKLSNNVIKILAQNYEIDTDKVINIIKNEELLFKKILKNGKKILNKYLKNIKKKNYSQLSGDLVFKLNTGAGLPLYIIEIVCQEHNIDIDYNLYYKLIESHKKNS